MAQKLPDIGTRFGKWTVRAHTILNKHQMTQSVCECDCGKFEVIINANLREGKTTQCRACSHHEKLARGIGLNQRLLPDDVQQIRTKLRQGMDSATLGHEYGVSTLTVYYIDRGMYWKHLPWPEGLGPRTTTTRGQPLLTDDEVTEIKLLLTQGVKQRDLAKQFKCSENTISSIKLGHTWKRIAWPEGYDPYAPYAKSPRK